MAILDTPFFATDTASRPTPVTERPADQPTLLARLIAAWLAPWTTGFTPLW